MRIRVYLLRSRASLYSILLIGIFVVASIGFTAKMLAFSYTMTPPNPRVLLVAGHTSNEGNRGTKGYYCGDENVYNDTIVNYFREKLYQNSGIDYIVAPSIKNLELRDKVKLAEKVKPDLYIEIHHDAGSAKDIAMAKKDGENSSLWDKMSGFCVLYYDDRYGGESAFPSKSKKFADLLADEMLKAGFKADSYHAQKREIRSVTSSGIYNRTYPNRLYVLRHAVSPAVLLECGYITSPYDVKILSNSKTHKKIVDAINAAIARYFIPSICFGNKFIFNNSELFK
jgi:N-acetylmuramoyl-L-alanine amidase